jgi:biotin transport system substrate-specific component
MTTQAASATILDRATGQSSLATPVKVASVALAVAVTAAAAQVSFPLPFTDVPFVLTPMAVILTGAALGSRLGALAQMSYLLLGALGLQVFAPDLRLPQGILRLVGPTGGYLIAYPLAAFLTGWLSERGWDRRYLTSLAAMLVGLATIYVGGIAWRLILLGSLDVVVATSVAPFLIPDVLKAAAAALILPGAWRLLGARP